MTATELLELWRSAIVEVAMVAAPFLVAALVVGVGVAILQTATQLQESALSFVPKLLAAMLVLGLAGHVLLDRLAQFTRRAFAAAAETHPELPTSDLPASTPDTL